jgi:hypothetical protein
MLLTCKASLAFKKLKAMAKTAFGSNVIISLRTLAAGLNPFPDLPVSLSGLQTLNDNLSAAAISALTGNHTAVAAVKTAMDAWDAGFKSVALYVSACVPGQADAIRSSGYVPTKSESTPKPKPGAVTDLMVSPAKGGLTAGSISSVPTTVAYITSVVPVGATVEYVGNTMVITIGTQSIYINADTRRQTEVDGLTTGVPVNVSMYCINAAGRGPAAPTQQVIPQ